MCVDSALPALYSTAFPPPPIVKKQVLEFEQQYLDALPSGQMYERSYMHRDTVTHVMVGGCYPYYWALVCMPACDVSPCVIL